MGAGASSGLGEKVEKASAEELRDALSGISAEQHAKIMEVLAVEADAEPPVELSFVLDELFRCFDADQDGQIEREEYLACWEQLSEILDQSFGPKQRKEKMKWLKDSGAEGSPSDGMYLSREKWQTAWLATAATESEISVDQEPKLAAWMWKAYAKQLVGVFFPSVKPAVAAVVDVPAGPRPEYPMSIPLSDMAAKIDEAKAWGLRPLIFGSGCSEVDVFFKYRIPGNLTIEAGSLFLMKKEEKKAALKRGMEYEGLCAPLLLKLGSAAADVLKGCCDEFPAEIFNGAAWTPKAAFEQEFISEGMKEKLEIDPARWKDFTMITYSSLGLNDGKAKLSDKIPNFENLAIIGIDPDSIAK